MSKLTEKDVQTMVLKKPREFGLTNFIIEYNHHEYNQRRKFRFSEIKRKHICPQYKGDCDGGELWTIIYCHPQWDKGYTLIIGIYNVVLKLK